MGGEEGAQRAQDTVPAAERSTVDEPGGAAAEQAAMEAELAEPEPTLGEATPEAGGGVGGAEAEAGGVAPAEDAAGGVEPRASPKWVLLEFARVIEQADLRWLAENGFQVDTVFGEKLVRGWLEASANRQAIASDPRIARIQAQMR